MSKFTDYTLVVGTDAAHLEQLKLTWPTWKKHKPSLLKVPMVVFRDKYSITEQAVREVIDHPNLSVVAWPLKSFGERCDYRRTGEPTKWNNPQRHKALAGFVYVPPLSVMTRYWLKLDTDVVATGNDNWIDPTWFDNCPAIVAQPWPYTKPADQMMKLDAWVEANENLQMLRQKPPLDLIPKKGYGTLRHHRVISWCGFFHTRFTAKVACWVGATCNPGALPVPSQDGCMYYCAKRLGFGIVRANMKKQGWSHWSTLKNVRNYAEEAMQ